MPGMWKGYLKIFVPIGFLEQSQCLAGPENVEGIWVSFNFSNEGKNDLLDA